MTIAAKDKYDVVVVGSGAAGQAAALTAQENGTSVLLLEKGRTTGGSANYSEGIFAVGSYLQKEKGIEVSGTDVLKEEVEYSKYKADSRIWRKYVDTSAENVQWLANEGVVFERVQAMGAGEATWHIYEGFGYGAIHKALEPKFLKLGGELLTSTAAVALKLNEDGSKTITLRNEADGTTEDVTAKVVVLAAGGYLNNKEMMAEETDYDLSRMIPVSSGKGTGDGLRLGWSVGGRKDGTGMAMLFGGYLDDPDQPYFKMMSSQMNVAAGQQPLLWVNEDGERFVDESVIYNFSYAGNALYTQNEVYSILDTGVIEKMAKDGNYMGLGVYVERGDKMDKLAADYLVAVEKGPFYAFKLNIGAFCTMGGLKVNVNNEVEDEKGKVIPGLYAAGNDASGLTGDTYGPNMPGTCAGYAFYSGRNAALDAQKYL
ncbi:FAD-dependent oxidoreductase [Lactobacillus delbrueckii]|uniref:FAD-dependent oxidoreductase n=1 Tax=Lactobacillus delbrueckii TaxID=1584 RepID=UPI003A875F2C